jgi:hypothetical protein
MTPSSYEAQVEKAAESYSNNEKICNCCAVTFKAGVAYANANPHPRVMKLVKAAKEFLDSRDLHDAFELNDALAEFEAGNEGENK